MTDPRDEIDNWLDTEVELLGPAPGTFGRVRRRARRRKAGRALGSAAAAAVVVAGIAVGPRIASTLTGQSPSPGRVAAGPLHSPSARPQPSTTPTRTKASAAPPTPASATAQPTTRSALGSPAAGAAVPANFQPTSVTFVGSHLGAVIGQAGTPGQCAGGVNCTSLAGTSDYGLTWFGVSAPPTVAPSGAVGVSQLRFLNTTQGFAFGPALWRTQHGGASWTQVALPAGVRVTDLETLDGEVYAVWARCTGSGPDFAASCTSFTLESAPAAGGAWHRVAGTGVLRSGGAASSATVVLAGGATVNPASATGYLLAPSGALLRGNLGGTAWARAGTAPCAPGAPQPGGAQPSGALLTAQSGQLYLVCTGATPISPSPAGSQTGSRQYLYLSADGGSTWQRRPTLPSRVSVTSVAAGIGGLVVLATSAGIEVSGDDGQTWRTAVSFASGPAGGFRYVGMTDAQHGVAVPADTSTHQIWLTYNGGQTWRASTVRSG